MKALTFEPFTTNGQHGLPVDGWYVLAGTEVIAMVMRHTYPGEVPFWTRDGDATRYATREEAAIGTHWSSLSDTPEYVPAEDPTDDDFSLWEWEMAE